MEVFLFSRVFSAYYGKKGLCDFWGTEYRGRFVLFKVDGKYSGATIVAQVSRQQMNHRTPTASGHLHGALHHILNSQKRKNKLLEFHSLSLSFQAVLVNPPQSPLYNEEGEWNSTNAFPNVYEILYYSTLNFHFSKNWLPMKKLF